MMKEAEFKWNSAAATRLRPPVHTWDETVRTHQASIYRLAYRLTGNSHDAEDLTQDVFVNLLVSPGTFSPSVSGSRLHRVTKALYRDQLRHRHHGACGGLLGEDAGNRLPNSAPKSSSVSSHRRCDATLAPTETVK